METSLWTRGGIYSPIATATTYALMTVAHVRPHSATADQRSDARRRRNSAAVSAWPGAE